MEQSRAERIQQRLRGAQRRQIKDVDFDFAIPQIPQIATPTTNQNEAQPSTSIAPPPSISRPTTTPSAAVDRARVTSISTPNDANTSAKRRKLDYDPPITTSSSRSTRSSRSQPRPDIYAIVDDAPPDPPELTREDAIEVPLTASVETEMIPETQGYVESAIPEPQPTPSVHFADESINILAVGTSVLESVYDEAELASVSRILEDGQQAKEVDSSDVETPIPASKRKRDARPLRKSTRISTSSLEEDDDELSPQQPKNPRGTTTSRPVRISKNTEADNDPLSNPVEPEEAEEVADVEAASILSRTRAKRKSIDFTPVSIQEDDTRDVVIPKPKRQRRGLTRAQQRQPKKPSSDKSSSAVKRSSSKRKASSGEPVQVTVHRLTEPLIYEGDNPNIDILNMEVPRFSRTGVNAVDTLMQVCKEFFTRQLEVLSAGRANSQDGATKREYANKHRSVSTFSEEVYARLVEHTINLDNSFVLRKRLKTGKQKQLWLREEILRIRSERQEVAHEMDEVRKQHEKESEVEGGLKSLNNSIHDIQLAVDRGKENGTEEVDNDTGDFQSSRPRLAKIGGLVSQKGNGGGILAQIRAFNDFLERSALSLEARRA